MSDQDETQNLYATHHKLQNDISYNSQRQSPDGRAALYNNGITHKILIPSFREYIGNRNKSDMKPGNTGTWRISLDKIKF